MEDAPKLPVEIIHEILCKCSMKEEAVASMICKDWYHAYSTRPVLKFNEKELHNGDASHELFFNFVSKTFRARTTPIDKVTISIAGGSEMSPYVDEWFEGVSRCSAKTLNFTAYNRSRMGIELLTLPQSIYEANSLQYINLNYCKLEGPLKLNMPIFRQLKKLIMSNVRFDDDRLLENIFSSCSHLQELEISGCEPIQKIYLGQNLKNLKEVSITSLNEKIPLELHAPHIADLWLEDVALSESFVHNFSKRFPQLVSLDLTNCSSLQRRLCFSSQSVKSLVLGDIHGAVEVDLDLPHLVNFTPDVEDIPFLLLTTAEDEFFYKKVIRCNQKVAMELNIDCDHMHIEASWLIKLRDLLKKSLAIKSISLCLDLFGVTVEKVRCFVLEPPLEIDELELEGVWSRLPSTDTGLILDGILCFLSPNSIFIWGGTREMSEFLEHANSIWKILMKRKCQLPCGCSNHLLGVELMGSNCYGKKLQKTSMEELNCHGKFTRIRFKLKWSR